MNADVDELKQRNLYASAELDQSPAASVIDLLIVLARNKRWVLRFTTVVGLFAAILSFLLPSWYTASTVILPPQGGSLTSSLLSQVGGMGALELLTGGTLGLKNPSDVYVAMLRSQTVEDAMIRRFNLMEQYRDKKLSDARQDFESHSTVIASPKDGLIRISVEARSAGLASEMANGYVEELRRLSALVAVTEASQRRLFFEQQLNDAKEKLAGAEESLKQTQLQTGLIQLDSEAKALMEAAATLRAQLAIKEIQIQTMRSYASEENPEMVLAKQQLAAIQAQLAQLAGTKQESSEDPLLPRGKVPGAGLEYVRKLREVKYYETMFQLLARQLELAKLDEAREGMVIQVMDRATPPDKRSFPKRTVLVVLSLAVAFLLASLWAIVRNRFVEIPENSKQRMRLRHLRDLLSDHKTF